MTRCGVRTDPTRFADTGRGRANGPHGNGGKDTNADHGQHRILDRALRVFFTDAVRVAFTSPAQAWFFLRTVVRQMAGARRRRAWQKRGVRVPPIIIFSITHRCNLECEGCYDRTLHGEGVEELSEAEVRRIVREASDLGVTFFVLAGGEPFIRPELLDVTGDFPGILFLVFTNGLLLDETAIARLKRQKNVIPLLSLEGDEQATDRRRGAGVFRRVRDVMRRLRAEGIFFGTSVTFTRANFEMVMDEAFVEDLIGAGCRFFLFMEYTPVVEGTEGLMPSTEQRRTVMARMNEFGDRHRALFIAVPQHETEVGGCLAAGRGFVHVSAEGDLEPCPFAPFSDRSVRDGRLIDALGSDLLRAIRAHPERLDESKEPGCALWRQRRWVESLLEHREGKNEVGEG